MATSRADVDEDRDRAEHEMAMLPQAPASASPAVCRRPRSVLGDAGKLKQREDDCDQEQHRREAEIRHLHERASAAGAPRRAPTDRISIAPIHGPIVVPERVEGLRQVQAARGRRGGPRIGDVRVGGDLQQRDAGREHEQRAEEQRIRPQRGGRIEQRGSHAATPSPTMMPASIADPLDEPARRQRHRRSTRRRSRTGPASPARSSA